METGMGATAGTDTDAGVGSGGGGSTTFLGGLSDRFPDRRSIMPSPRWAAQYAILDPGRPYEDLFGHPGSLHMAAISATIPGSRCAAHRFRFFPGKPNDGLDMHPPGPGYEHPVRLVLIIPSWRWWVHISGFDPGAEKMGRLAHLGCLHRRERSSHMPGSL